MPSKFSIYLFKALAQNIYNQNITFIGSCYHIEEKPHIFWTKFENSGHSEPVGVYAGIGDDYRVISCVKLPFK